MSVLPAEVNAQLVQLLQQLQSPDNNVRSQAEDVLQDQWTSQRPEWLLMGLAEQIARSEDHNVCLTLDPAHAQRILSPADTLRKLGTILRRSYLQADSFQDPQERLCPECRDLHFLRPGTRHRHPHKALGGFGNRV